MGTNYYTKTEVCPTCGRSDEAIHLGKSSFGWKFLFQYNNATYYSDIPSMKKWLRGKQIYDEYDKKISKKQFWDLVEAKRDGLTGDYHEWDIQGYRFVNHEFS